MFQLFSHKALCDDDSEDMQQTKGYEGANPFQLYKRRDRKNIADSETASNPSLTEAARTSSSRPEGANSDLEHGNHATVTSDTEEPEQPQMSVTVCLCLLIVVTVVRAYCHSEGNFSNSSLVGCRHCGVPRRLH